MAYKPTDTYIPCKTNGFIVDAYTKSYRFSIAKPTKYPEEEAVYGVIWIVDIEAMSKAQPYLPPCHVAKYGWSFLLE